MRKLALNGKYGKGRFALVDDGDFKRLNNYYWTLGDGGYPQTNTYQKKIRNPIRLHYLIMNTPKGFLTDHINGDRLDNRRVNLRICTAKQNSLNRRNKLGKTNLKGVSILKAHPNLVRSYTNNNYKQIHIGNFTNTPEGKHLGALFHDFWALELHKEFANINFPVVKHNFF